MADESIETLRQQVLALEQKYAAFARQALAWQRTAEQVRRLDALLAYFEAKRKEREEHAE